MNATQTRILACLSLSALSTLEKEVKGYTASQRGMRRLLDSIEARRAHLNSPPPAPVKIPKKKAPKKTAGKEATKEDRDAATKPPEPAQAAPVTVPATVTARTRPRPMSQTIA